METQFQDLIIRRPTSADLETVYQLIIACDIAEYGDPDTELGDLRQEWREVDLAHDVWLAYDRNTLVGYAIVFAQADKASFDFYTHPERDLADLAAYLIAQSEARAKAVATQEIALTTIIPSVNQPAIAAIEATGFAVSKYYFRMQIDLTEPPSPPPWPTDCILRPIQPETEAQRVFDFIYQAFDWRDSPPPDFAWWRSYMMREDHFRPELWFLLFQQETLIGTALCYDYDDHGWVRQLAVAKPWRRHGLGSNLLRHVFGVFYQRGHRQVALGVEANNNTAVTFYERVGMYRARQFNEYAQSLSK